MKKTTTRKASKKAINDTYNFLTGLCACRKMLVTGKVEKPVGGTIKVFNAYRKDSERYNKCSNVHAEVFAGLVGKTVSAYGLKCTFKQGKNVDERYMVFDKMPQGLEVK